MSNKYQDVMLRKEKAGQKAEIANRGSRSVKYEIRGNDVVIMSGTYINKGVRELWNLGESERDYIIEKLWSLGDEEVNTIIKSMTCE